MVKEERVKEAFEAHMRTWLHDPYELTDTLDNLGFDSLDKVETLMEMEKRLNIVINDDDAWRIINLPLKEIFSEVAKLT
jgi:acyl carrier protein